MLTCEHVLYICLDDMTLILIYIYIYIYITHTCTFTCTRAYTCIHEHAIYQSHACICLDDTHVILTHIYTCMHTLSLMVQTYPCMHTCIYPHTYLHIYAPFLFMISLLFANVALFFNTISGFCIMMTHIPSCVYTPCIIYIYIYI